MTDLSTASHSRSSVESSPADCSFASALRLAAEFFAQQQHLQQQQQHQMQQQQFNLRLLPYLRCRQQQQTSGQLQSALGQQSMQAQQTNQMSSQENSNTLSGSHLALLQAGNEHPAAAAAFHAHLLLQSQVSLRAALYGAKFNIHYLTIKFFLPQTTELLTAEPSA